jgi:hypothetical protein
MNGAVRLFPLYAFGKCRKHRLFCRNTYRMITQKNGGRRTSVEVSGQFKSMVYFGFVVLSLRILENSGESFSRSYPRNRVRLCLPRDVLLPKKIRMTFTLS